MSGFRTGRSGHQGRENVGDGQDQREIPGRMNRRSHRRRTSSVRVSSGSAPCGAASAASAARGIVARTIRYPALSKACAWPAVFDWMRSRTRPGASAAGREPQQDPGAPEPTRAHAGWRRAPEHQSTQPPVPPDIRQRSPSGALTDLFVWPSQSVIEESSFPVAQTRLGRNGCGDAFSACTQEKPRVPSG